MMMEPLYHQNDFVDWDAEQDPFGSVPQPWEKRICFDDANSLPSDHSGSHGTEFLDGDETTGFVSAPPCPPSLMHGNINAKVAIGSEPTRKTEPANTGPAKTKAAKKKTTAMEPKKGKRGRTKVIETPEERKERMALACRKFRAKRKEEISSLREKNAILEQERETYLQRIADLQTEAQMFRDHGAVDMQRENELLRVEIRKHKTFISTLVNAVQATPMITDEEKLRLLQDGLGSAIGQVMGLAYTSAADPAWKCGPSVVLYDHLVHLRYQYLPLGSTIADAKRVNLRIDVPGIDLAVEELADKLWRTWADQEICRKIFETHFPEVFKIGSFTLNEVFPELSDGSSEDLSWVKNDIRVFHYTERDNNNEHVSDMLMALTKKNLDIFSAAYPPMTDVDGLTVQENMDENVAVPVHVLVNASSNLLQKQAEHFQPKTEGVERLNAPMVEGYVLRKAKNDKVHTTALMSYPLKVGLFGLSMKSEPIVNEDGTLGSEALQMLKATMGVICNETVL